MTFTVEHDFDETTITILDDSAEIDDVKFHFTDTGLEIVQITDIGPVPVLNIIELSYNMLEELILAYNSPEGLYRVTHGTSRK